VDTDAVCEILKHYPPVTTCAVKLKLLGLARNRGRSGTTPERLFIKDPRYKTSLRAMNLPFGS
jgi:hypothetical protein